MCDAPDGPTIDATELDSGHGGDEGLWRQGGQRVQLASAVTLEEHRVGVKVLNWKKNERVKFNTNIVVLS